MTPCIYIAIATGIGVIGDLDSSQVGGVHFALTTMSFKERLNAIMIISELQISVAI